jgi:putative oxidoreductase
MEALYRIRITLLALTQKISWLPPLVTRLTLGVIFIGTGWGKLHNLAKVTDYFGKELHIPAAGVCAVLVGTAELVCGTLLLVGLVARLAAIPLIITMLVAIIAAKASDLDGIRDLFGLQEFDYLVMLIWIAVVGPSLISADHFIARRLVAARDEERRSASAKRRDTAPG